MRNEEWGIWNVISFRRMDMKNAYLAAAMLSLPLMMDAQSAIDGFRFSQPDMKGTARYMGMAGAFGALGGDLSSIATNPAGIGVYRRSEIGITMDLDLQSAQSTTNAAEDKVNQTKFLLNNVGGIASWSLNNDIMPVINLGFTYNKAASFNRHYSGSMNLSNSLTNYIAGITNAEGVTVADVSTTSNFDPYNPNDGGYAAPWLSILGYDSYFITPLGDPDQPQWIGQWGSRTNGYGAFDVETKGSVDEYNIAIGGNFVNQLFWGVSVGIVDMNYSITAQWAERLSNASVDSPTGEEDAEANTNLTNFYNANGNGFNVKLGLIYRPIQELRLGFSFATPTWYSINENYLARTKFAYSGPNIDKNDGAITNDGYYGENSYNYRTPWKLTGSVAGVIGRSLILSADVEWQLYGKSRFYDSDNGYYGGGGVDWDWDDYWYAPSRSEAQKASPKLSGNDPWYATNQDIRDIYRTTTTFRVGAEYRVTPRFSVRLGYAHTDSPVKSEAKDGSMLIWTSGTMPNYRLDNSTDYITCGLGYNFNSFYIDGAFVHKHQNSEYHAYTPDPANPQIPSPSAKLGIDNNQIIVSAGFKF